MVDLGSNMGLIQKSGSWFSIGDERIGQGRDNAKLYLQQHPEVSDEIEAKIRENLYAANSRPRARAAEKAVDVSADDFNDET